MISKYNMRIFLDDGEVRRNSFRGSQVFEPFFGAEKLKMDKG
ncbi:MAG: hypothetical protein BSOLF_2266 [Candidatus Carbobacillus altaicus]|uniref:Uncharacterized protein n=1 Tax=Candidatus Carbonibacillus altaicus TaxID=2163959 RepID=A0A2R6XY78_9BACL|nr:MAG: hypothetical protein BSOLF_2266 [Candidatus Carbobacillus altaicus]